MCELDLIAGKIIPAIELPEINKKLSRIGFPSLSSKLIEPYSESNYKFWPTLNFESNVNGGNPAPGGAGQYSTISGSNTAYAGGGGGWNYPTATQSAGGVGGGGIGGHSNTYYGTAGTANTGGGGGSGTS